MAESLSLLFPELPLAPRSANAARIVDKFERLAHDADGPIRAMRRTAARDAEYGEFAEDLNPKLREVLRQRGIEKPYSHQAEAYLRIAGGDNVVIVTPTASGKTLCYNLPVAESLDRRSGRAGDVSVPDQGAGRRSAARIARR